MKHLSVSHLKQAIAIKEQIAHLEAQLLRIFGGITTTPHTPSPKKRGGISAAGRARIIAAQKARWAKIKGVTPAPATAPKKKGGLSTAGRARIAAAQKARWARIKGKTSAATKSVKAAPKKRGKMSAAARAKLAKLMKARWAVAKKKGVTLTGRKK